MGLLEHTMWIGASAPTRRHVIVSVSTVVSLVRSVRENY